MTKTTVSGGFCKWCGNWIDHDERCSCQEVSGYHWGDGPAEEAGPVQEYAIGCLEDALSLVDDHLMEQAA